MPTSPCSPEFCKEQQADLEELCEELPGSKVIFHMPDGTRCYCACGDYSPEASGGTVAE